MRRCDLDATRVAGAMSYREMVVYRDSDLWVPTHPRGPGEPFRIYCQPCREKNRPLAGLY